MTLKNTLVTATVITFGFMIWYSVGLIDALTPDFDDIDWFGGKPNDA